MIEKNYFISMRKKYLLLKDGVEYIVITHRKNLNISLVNAGHMKRLVNVSKKKFLLVIKKKMILVMNLLKVLMIR